VFSLLSHIHRIKIVMISFMKLFRRGHSVPFVCFLVEEGAHIPVACNLQVLGRGRNVVWKEGGKRGGGLYTICMME
jgi:hypothetical protein